MISALTQLRQRLDNVRHTEVVLDALFDQSSRLARSRASLRLADPDLTVANANEDYVT